MMQLKNRIRLCSGWTGACSIAGRAVLKSAKYESGWRRWATGEEMKVVLVLVLMAFAAATALAYGNHAVSTSVTAVAVQVAGSTSEPAALLLSGSLLLGLAGAVRRFTL
jgi:hypothetical protein